MKFRDYQKSLQKQGVDEAIRSYGDHTENQWHEMRKTLESNLHYHSNELKKSLKEYSEHIDEGGHRHLPKDSHSDRAPHQMGAISYHVNMVNNAHDKLKEHHDNKGK